MTRSKDVNGSLDDRSKKANYIKADYFISIHFNSAGSKEASGIETFCYPSGSGKTLAKEVQKAMMHAFPKHKNRGVKEADFSVLRKTNMPAILVECEFLSNDEMCKKISTDEWLKNAAYAISVGIIETIDPEVIK